MTGYAYDSWEKFCSAVEGWGDPAHLSLVQAERRLAENANSGLAMYRNVNYLPGTLQTLPYIDGLCRGAYLDETWSKRNYTTRMSRQELLAAAGVRQSFLVSELALTFWPGRFIRAVSGQLHHLVKVIRDDMKNANKLDFRVIPKGVEPPADAYDDTFYLFKDGDDTIAGFKEPWGTLECTLIEVNGEEREHLKTSWTDLGKLALDREESLSHVSYLANNWQMGDIR